MSHARLFPLTFLLALAGPLLGAVVPGGSESFSSPWAGLQPQEDDRISSSNYLVNALAQLQNQQMGPAEQLEGLQQEGEMPGANDVADIGEEVLSISSRGAQSKPLQMSFTLQLPPHIGQVPGLALDPQNRLILFHRSGRVWDEL